MEVIESESTVIKKDQLIVLYCIEDVERNYVFSTATSFCLYARVAHMSFIEKLEERRTVLLYDIDDEEVQQLQQMPYPLCVKVQSCCDFSFLHDGEKRDVVVIAKFTKFPSVIIEPIQPTDSYVDDIFDRLLGHVDVEMHRKANRNCNCTEFSQGAKILQRSFLVPEEQQQGACGNQNHPVSTVTETHPENLSETEDNTDPEELFSQIFAGRGSYWEERYQSSLKQCRLKRGRNENVEIRLEFEPENPKDKNAIRFDALLDDTWNPLGYVGREKIPKVSSAIRNNEIRSITLTNVRSAYVPHVDKLMMTGFFAIVKSKKWLADVSRS